MRLNEIVFNDAQPVESYGPGFFRIGGERIDGPVIAAPSGTRTWGGFEDVQPLLDLAADVDVIFVGTGADIAHLPQTLRDQLDAAGVGVEAMSSPSASRTYNVLLSEGRRIALAMLPV
ncbi:Mth938-like domain-containing protein [Sulfitobacter sp. S190]|uniref:Mth938-like domain-containing protein n=1 Tax=Sulfitobacter sp. S190 TaxID=2867022 RepID=UPI0021A4E8B9|nr:Mth938-like domain-containing protein [Sulfitobacter sp. S190]UWR21323.1 Mth938-like domain-containing protein [Sulfitobacter sp. S190]